MVLFGDDYQLPAIGDSGATSIPQLNNKTRSKGTNDMNQCQGGLQFLNLSEEVMELDQVARQSEDQAFFKSILERLRLGLMMEQDDARLTVLTLDDDNYTQNDMEDLSEGALHLYATHQQKNAYHEEMLRRTVTEYNPLVVIKCKDETSSNNNKFMLRHLNNTTYDMRKTMVCRAAMVEL
jgi:hypothetical protein